MILTTTDFRSSSLYYELEDVNKTLEIHLMASSMVFASKRMLHIKLTKKFFKCLLNTKQDFGTDVFTPMHFLVKNSIALLNISIEKSTNQFLCNLVIVRKRRETRKLLIEMNRLRRTSLLEMQIGFVCLRQEKMNFCLSHVSWKFKIFSPAIIMRSNALTILEVAHYDRCAYVDRELCRLCT